jgi:prepilin-type processing-associated H-X9-DG protein
MYLTENERRFPLAWHIEGATLAQDLSNLTFYRSELCHQTRSEFRQPLSPGADPVAAQRRKFAVVQARWTDPAGGGWTRDYFAPDIIFRMPDPANALLAKPVEYYDVTDRVGVSASDRPLLADVNASLPNPEARDPNDPEHEAEMRNGFSVVQAAGMDVFVGVGPSLRRAGDTSTSRFDFRHRGGVNVLFLDGHVDLVKADEKARLEKIHRYWDSIDPASEKEPKK